MASRLSLIAPVAVLATVAAGVAVVSHDPGQASVRADRASSGILAARPDKAEDRTLRASRGRSALREPLLRSAASAEASGQVREIKPKIAGSKYVTTGLNVWTGPGERFTFLTVLPPRTKVPVTDNTNGQWAEIVQDGESRWVKATYLADQKPQPEPVSEDSAVATVEGISSAPCASGSSAESGLTSDAVLVHRSVCANFPEVTTYGGVRSDGDHSQGVALDIMVPSSSTGDAIAEWVRANSGALGASEVLWAQEIWTVQRGSEGWRAFEDRGSATANHFDHVHVTVYGDSAG